MTGNHQLDTLIAAILIGGSFAVLYAGFILCYRLFFTRSHDDYPIKYYAKISKKTKSQGKVVAFTEPDDPGSKTGSC